MVPELKVNLALLNVASGDAEGSVLGVSVWLGENPREVRSVGDALMPGTVLITSLSPIFLVWWMSKMVMSYWSAKRFRSVNSL